MFDSNHSLLYIPMHCKIEKSVLSGSSELRIKGDHAYRYGDQLVIACFA